MSHTPHTKRLAVCSWSLQPTGPHDLAAKLRATGIKRVQLALDPLREAPTIWGETGKLFRKLGIEIVSGMFRCAGEDYSTPDSIRRTGGIVPDATWEENLRNIRATAKIAAKLRLRLVTFHAGYLPHAESDPDLAKMLGRLEAVAEIFSEEKIMLGLETGQETAQALSAFLRRLGRPDVGVNFDPANMILYGNGDPVQAVRLLGPWVWQVHIKDAIRSKKIGHWGKEVAFGEGQVDWPEFFDALGEIEFADDLVIEREAGTRCVADIRRAWKLFEKLNR